MSTIPLMGIGTTGPGGGVATKFVILNPTDGNVGDSIAVTVQAQDSGGNVVTTYQQDVTLVTDGSATGGGLVNIVNGVGSLNITDNSIETVNLSLSDTQGTGLDCTSTQNLVFAAGNGIDKFTVTMLHMDGSNGGTTFTDSEITPKTYTAHGGAVTSTAFEQFGTASGLFVSVTSSYIDTADSSDFNFGAGNFTIDFWMRAVSATAGDDIYCNGSGNDGNRILIASTNAIRWQSRFGGGAETILTTPDSVFSTLTWTHVALVRNGNRWDIYVGGTSQANMTDTTTLADKGSGLSIGCRNVTFDAFYNGYLDEFRISKGVARWTSNFTPPVAPYATN